MQRSSSSSSLTKQLGERWLTLLNRLQEDPKFAQVMSTRIGQYLSSRPFLALALLLFSAMAALPVGIFLLFAIITIVMSVVGFVFFEVFLLFVGGMTLLSVLSGIALFSLLASVIVTGVFVTLPNLLRRQYYLTKRNENEEGTQEMKQK
ncbi:lipid droplet assembly factor 1-like [Cyprinodon tularosa]|uniref:lipid droplet assembly factor 1-like n=1 Tax=Cyprinodon tularosa TaxID=77115 RepID=UPI0018E2858B|nr:lipid droplet assembly factor 1-like [Cyprinodon tularosa]XP_038163657.1 lipid droplet assembly factor 1-like [Cyprinodon tularosa]